MHIGTVIEYLNLLSIKAEHYLPLQQIFIKILIFQIFKVFSVYKFRITFLFLGKIA